MSTKAIFHACLGLILSIGIGHSAAADEAHMEVLDTKDVSGEVFMRLGLPNQNYCHQQCLKEERCKAVRWGFIEGTTAGQCQLLTGDLTFGEPKSLKTYDGQRIVVIVSLKEGG
ncbi:MAG: hypothetical protein GX535_09715 [Xanthomonadaceae bacterium]|nr:hypothetical protein [Xanthomonadaceae bacterium]